MTILAKHQCLQKMRIVSWLGSSADGIRKENDDKIHKEPSRQNPSVNTSPRRMYRTFELHVTASLSLSLSLSSQIFNIPALWTVKLKLNPLK